jgi:hypothetical protein
MAVTRSRIISTPKKYRVEKKSGTSPAACLARLACRTTLAHIFPRLPSSAYLFLLQPSASPQPPPSAAPRRRPRLLHPAAAPIRSTAPPPPSAPPRRRSGGSSVSPNSTPPPPHVPTLPRDLHRNPTPRAAPLAPPQPYLACRLIPIDAARAPPHRRRPAPPPIVAILRLHHSSLSCADGLHNSSASFASSPSSPYVLPSVRNLDAYLEKELTC